MKKHMKLIGIAVFLVALIVACGNKKDKEELQAAIDKAEKMLVDNKLMNNPMRMFPEIQERRDEVKKTLEDAQKVHDDEDGDYKAALDKVNEAITEIESIVADHQKAKSEPRSVKRGQLREGDEGTGPRAGGRTGGMRSSQQRTVQPAGDDGGTVTTEQNQPTTQNKPAATKRKPGSRLRDR